MQEIAVRKIVEVPIADVRNTTRFASFLGVDKEHFAILIGDYQTQPVLTRVHSECITGDMFGSKRCDCGPQLREALAAMDKRGGGVLIYMRQEGRGIGLFSKLDAYELQSMGIDTFEANEMLGYAEDGREFESAALMLKALGVTQIELITNNPDKEATMQAHGIVVEKRVPSGVFLTKENEHYLRSKVEKKHHTIDLA